MKTPRLFMLIILIAISLALFLHINYKKSHTLIIRNTEGGEVVRAIETPFELNYNNLSEKEKRQIDYFLEGYTLVEYLNSEAKSENIPLNIEDIIIKVSELDYEKMGFIEVRVTETGDESISEDKLKTLKSSVARLVKYEGEGAYFSIVNQSEEILYDETLFVDTYFDRQQLFSSTPANISEKEKHQLINEAVINKLISVLNKRVENNESLPITIDDIIIKESEHDYEKIESIEVKVTETSDISISEDSLIEIRYVVTGSFDYKDKKGAYISIVNQPGEILYEEII